MQYTAIFQGCKNYNFQMKKCNCFFSLILAQNIDCGYSLEPPHNLCFRTKKERKIMYTLVYVYPCKPQFYYIKVGCKGSTLHGHVSLMSCPIDYAGTERSKGINTN